MKKLILIGLLAVIMCSCSKAATKATLPDDVAKFQDEAETTEVFAETIAEDISKIDGIQTATVLVNGKTAIVGIDLKTKVDDIKLMATKKEVEERVKELAPDFDRVAVTAAPDLVERITKISNTTKRPTSYNKDLEEIISALTPIV